MNPQTVPQLFAEIGIVLPLLPVVRSVVPQTDVLMTRCIRYCYGSCSLFQLEITPVEQSLLKKSLVPGQLQPVTQTAL